MAFTQVTVHGARVRNPDGSPGNGTAVFVPSATMRNATGQSEIRVASAVTAKVVNGAVQVVLAATDDPGTTPIGVTYEVREYLIGVKRVRTYHLAVPSASPTLDLATAPIVESIPGAITVPVPGPPGPAGADGADGTQIVSLTQAAYDALTPDPATLYVVTG